ncbi:chaperonin 10-like protein [Poronia punctata]|nr:chaperonin 10-like protein [Poronia punctata]
MKAIKVMGPKRAKVRSNVPRSAVPDDCILVRIMAVSLNQTDWKHIDFIPTKGATVGCDYSGIVEEVGSKVKGNLQVGDRVAGFTHGCNGDCLSDGSFAEYIAVKGHIQIKLPDLMSFESGCTLAVGVTTLASPTIQECCDRYRYILVYGGSTATGTLAIQLAKLSGYRVITTCSPNNFGLVLVGASRKILRHVYRQQATTR